MRKGRRSRSLAVTMLRALGLAAGAVAVCAPPAAAAAADGRAEAKSLMLSFFELEATNGYSLEGGSLRKGTSPPTVTIGARRRGLRVTYEVTGESGPGVHAVFGALGSVSLDFHRRKRSVDRPAKGCVWITETGVFRGRLSFSGEGGYTAADASAIPGEVVRLPNGFCGASDDRHGRSPYPDLLRATRLAARSRTDHGFVQFEASARALALDSRVAHRALVQEGVGPMTISRSATASGARNTFSLGSEEQPRTAVVHPPAPFEGSASLSDPVGGPPAWRGALSVTLPGLAVPTPLAGAGFAARLCLHSSLLGSCEAALPPPTARA